MAVGLHERDDGEDVLAYAKQRTGRALASRALQADAAETWGCAYLSLALLVGVGLNLAFGWW